MAASRRDLGRAYRAGYHNKPLPDDLAEDSFARSAHHQGADDRAAGRPEDPELAGLGDEPSEDAPQKPAGKGGKRSTGKSRKSASGSASTKRPGRTRRSGPSIGGRARDLIAHPATLGGDGGGLLLAVFAYPIVLAILQHGPSGATDWLKAKFLNIDTHPAKKRPFYHQGNPGGPRHKAVHE